MSDGGVLDTYLIAQALGMEWNLWTMILIDGVLFIIAILFVLGMGILCLWLDS